MEYRSITVAALNLIPLANGRRPPETDKFKLGFLLRNDEEGDVRDEVEGQDKQLECPNEGVDCHVERFS